MKTKTTTQPDEGQSPAATFTATMIPLEKIKPSRTNPRQRFNAEEQQELERSMRAHGFTLSTMLLRPMPGKLNVSKLSDTQFFLERVGNDGHVENLDMFSTEAAANEALEKHSGFYELVAGERRWRAAKAAGMTEGPGIVRDLGDVEVLEIQLIENCQRVDLSPLEEAKGLRRLLDLRDADGKPIHTMETLHQRLGKGVRHIEKRVKLCVLSQDSLPAVVEAIDSGVLPAKTAYLIASVPDPAMRAQYADEVLNPKSHEAPLSFTQAENLLHQKFKRNLNLASFDLKDATLVPVEFDGDGKRCGGGDCITCPLMLGNAKHLFSGAIPGGGSLHKICMLPACYERKNAEDWRRFAEEHHHPEKGRTAASEAESLRLYQSGDMLGWENGKIDLGERPDSYVLKPGETCASKWKELVKGQGAPVLVARDRFGRAHELVDRVTAIAAATANGHGAIFKKTQSEAKAPAATDGGARMNREAIAEQQRANEDRERKEALAQEVEAAQTMAMCKAIADRASAAKTVPNGFWVEIAAEMLEGLFNDDPGEIERRRGWKDGDLIPSMMKLPQNEQMGVVAELIFKLAMHGGSKIAKMFGVDEKKVTAEAAAAMKAEQKNRAAVLAEIVKAGVSAADLDKLAKAHYKKPFAEIRSSHELKFLLGEIGRGKSAGSSKPPKPKPAQPAKTKPTKKADRK